MLSQTFTSVHTTILIYELESPMWFSKYPGDSNKYFDDHTAGVDINCMYNKSLDKNTV